ncbi:MAG: amidohydrolase [Gammaproteobacteria bacterium]|nr:MAG: amidohydrolase [Gammaproteobacteria bacterium]
MRGALTICPILMAAAAVAARESDLDQPLPLEPARQISIDTNEGTWLSPDIAPDGATIVFELLGDLFSVDARGGAAHALTTGMAFDSQPVFSPDGRDIAFLSDRSGAENLWLIAADGSNPRQLTTRDDNSVFASPAWSADGKSIFVSHYRSEFNGFELWQVDVSTRAATVLIPMKSAPDTPHERLSSVLGAFPSADGGFLYFARHIGENDFAQLPQWTIVRRDLASGKDEVLVYAPTSPRPDLLIGSAFRPAVSHSGTLLVYGSRDRGLTGLRVLNLETREDRWLRYPVQQDELQASGWRDLLPRHVFTPDDRAVIANVDGRIVGIDLAGGGQTEIPFHVREELPIGPSTRRIVRQESGAVRARIIQTPVQSPDGRSLAFSALGSVYLMSLDGHSKPLPIIDGFQPSWSPDGKRLVFVRWNARDAGHVWLVAASGGEPVRISETPAYYTSPVFTPDGREILALRSSNALRMHSYMEYGALRQCELVRMSVPQGPPRSNAVAAATPAQVVTRGLIGGTPHFGSDPAQVYLSFSDGVHAVRLDGSGDRMLVGVTGPGWYFAEGRAQADDLRVSPDGRWVLAQIAQQLHLLQMPEPGKTIDVAQTDIGHRKLTGTGADFFGWADRGRTITWTLGSHFYRVPLDAPRDGKPESFAADVQLLRSVVRGSILLRGATVITEHDDEVIPNADLLIRDDRIAAVGPRGTVAIPGGAKIWDATGKWIVPGFVDAHDHIADIRRGILDFESWGPLANLAFGVTTAFDPSPLSIDMLAYQDAVDTGQMLGSRIASTGPAIFSFNEFESYAQVRAVLSRYRDDYRVGNIKMYRSGNRRVRQWIIMAARELGLQPTTEGALSMKLDISQIIDGYAGNEHALTAVPLYADMLALVAKSGVGWTATLQITNGGPEGQDYFIVRDHPAEDAKLNRFAPRFVVDMKTRVRTYREPGEYLFPRVAASVAAAQRAGGLIGIGAHGEMPGLGFHWELQAHTMGGMTPAEALRAGTIGSATHIGRGVEFGSLEPGKYADLVILERNPLTDISNTLAIAAVMEGGRLRDGATLAELWPESRPLPRRWYCDDRPPGTRDPCD